MDDNNRTTTPPATVYLSEMLPLTGSSIVIDGRTVDGRRYSGRLLDNVSWIPTPDGRHRVSGFDPDRGGVRTFRLDLVETVRVVGGPTLSGHDLVATMSAAVERQAPVGPGVG